ncbi:hypothetical protein [Gorillibacterium sp. sgz500922]|uniref:hypothetical protein n=1 Tax=Gorillibacterium sp. sgz500922 TaxID=3446694 RepID=UPI003F6700AC
MPHIIDLIVRDVPKVFITVGLSILFPVLLYKLISRLKRTIAIFLYWLLLPIGLAIGFWGPFLVMGWIEADDLDKWDFLLDYSLKTGFFFYVFIPMSLTALICTMVGYVRALVFKR